MIFYFQLEKLILKYICKTIRKVEEIPNTLHN